VGFLFDLADDGFTGGDDPLFVLVGGPGVFLGEDVEIGLAEEVLGARSTWGSFSRRARLNRTNRDCRSLK